MKNSMVNKIAIIIIAVLQSIVNKEINNFEKCEYTTEAHK